MWLQIGDIAIEGKKTLDAFHSTVLDYLLHANEIEHVAFVGFHTNGCLEFLIRSAYDKGYQTIVVSNCTETDTHAEQEYAEIIIFLIFGKMMIADEFLTPLGSTLCLPTSTSALDRRTMSIGS